MNIFVAKLNYNTSEEDLQALFEGFGAVNTANIIFDKDENRSKGFGFVEMENDTEALIAIENLNQTELDGKIILVKRARPWAEGDSSHGRART